MFPTTLSVVGMVSEPMAEIATPPLTTISFPADEMGDVAARILLDRVVRGRTAPEQVLVRPDADGSRQHGEAAPLIARRTGSTGTCLG